MPGTPSAADLESAKKRAPLQFVLKNQLPKSKSGKSILIPTPEKHANHVHPCQRYLVQILDNHKPQYTSYLPEESKNPFTSAPVFLPAGPDVTEAEVDDVITRLARRAGAGEQIFIAVDNEANPQDPNSFNVVGIEGYSEPVKNHAKQRFNILNSMTASLIGAKKVIQLHKERNLDLAAAAAEVIPDSTPLPPGQHVLERTKLQGYAAYLLDKQEYDLRALPAEVDQALMKAVAQGHDKLPLSEAYVSIGTDAEKRMHQDIIADAVSDAQDAENKNDHSKKNNPNGSWTGVLQIPVRLIKSLDFVDSTVLF